MALTLQLVGLHNALKSVPYMNQRAQAAVLKPSNCCFQRRRATHALPHIEGRWLWDLEPCGLERLVQICVSAARSPQTPVHGGLHYSAPHYRWRLMLTYQSSVTAYVVTTANGGLALHT